MDKTYLSLMRMPVPSNSPIKTIADLVNTTLTIGAQTNASNLYLSQQQSLQGIIHSEMCQTLAQYAAAGDFDTGMQKYKKMVEYPVDVLLVQF